MNKKYISVFIFVIIICISGYISNFIVNKIFEKDGEFIVEYKSSFPFATDIGYGDECNEFNVCRVKSNNSISEMIDFTGTRRKVEKVYLKSDFENEDSKNKKYEAMRSYMNEVYEAKYCRKIDEKKICKIDGEYKEVDEYWEVK